MVNTQPTWNSGCLWFGAMMVAETVGWGTEDGVRFRPSGGAWSDPYQEPTDLQQDAEAEVLRLLKDAGVTLE
jgi:hypothetical protein